eukprot:COSAG01_NODE_48319_length_382_cov_1.201413_1_plen_27_part_10
MLAVCVCDPQPVLHAINRRPQHLALRL